MRVEPITHDNFTIDGVPEEEWLEELRADGDTEEAEQWPSLRAQCAEAAQRELITVLRADGFKLVKDDPEVTIQISIQEMEDEIGGELGGEVIIKNRAGDAMYRLLFEPGALPDAPTNDVAIERDGKIEGAQSLDAWLRSFTHAQQVFERYRSVIFAVRKYIEHESSEIWWMH